MSTARPTRVLVLTVDKVGAAMAGPAIRSVELAAVLAAESAVTLASPHPVDREVPGVRTARFTGEGDLRSLVAGADVVLAMAGVLHRHPWIGEISASGAAGPAVIVDAYDPVLFEVLELFAGADQATRQATAADATAAMVEPLRRADLVLVASERQRHLVLGMLAALGRIDVATYDLDPTLEHLVAIVPFGLPDRPPSAGDRHPLRQPHGPFEAGDFVLLWGGGLYQWLDPVTLVEGVAAIDDPAVKAFVLAGAHPTPDVPTMEMAARTRARAAELGLAGTRVVFAEDWIPYDERAPWLLDADLSISLHRSHLETTFAFRTRLLDSLWAELPIVCSDGDTLADLVRREGLGEVVPPGDAEAFAAAVVRLREARCYSAARLALRNTAPSYTWAKVAQPIVEFCRRPTIAPDRAARGPARPAPTGDRAARSVRVLARRGRDLVRRGSAALGGPGRRHREQM